MDSGLYNAIGAMNGQQRSMEIISHNIANMSTHGYKRRTPNAESFAAMTDFGGAKALGTNAVVDFSQGDLERTGSAMHMALDGDGFFAAEGENGEMYTRYGAFTMDGDGNLVTPAGYPLAWEQRLVDFDPAGPEPVVDENGRVSQGAVINGTLKIVDFENRERMRELPYGFWEPTIETPEVESTATVRQGMLERSNAKGVIELIQLIETQRAYDVAARTVRSIDQSYQRLTQSRNR